MSDAAPIESPCIKVCTLDETGAVCLGCFRNLEEIGLWSQLSNAQRSQVLARIAERRRRFEAASNWKRLSCERCGAAFSCGAADPAHPCWCTGYPAVTPSGTDAACLCPRCLAAAAT